MGLSKLEASLTRAGIDNVIVWLKLRLRWPVLHARRGDFTCRKEKMHPTLPFKLISSYPESNFQETLSGCICIISFQGSLMTEALNIIAPFPPVLAAIPISAGSVAWFRIFSNFKFHLPQQLETSTHSFVMLQTWNQHCGFPLPRFSVPFLYRYYLHFPSLSFTPNKLGRRLDSLPRPSIPHRNSELNEIPRL